MANAGSDTVEMEIPVNFCGEVINCNNATRAMVIVEKMTKGEDVLQGTGLTYGRDLVYDMSPQVSEGTADSPGTPVSPPNPSYSDNPYSGMGKF